MNTLFKYTILLIFILAFNKISAQNLVGKWQADSDKTSDKSLECYYFFSDNKFSYELNQYNGLNRIISLSGIYKISNHTIEFTILKTKEKIGGTYFRDHTISENDSWSLDDFKIIETEVKNSTDEAEIKVLSNNIIEIDNRKFYKIKDKL